MALGRKTGGKRKGFKAQHTLSKDAARELVRQTVTEHLQPLLDAQIASALGIKFLAVRQKSTGRFLRRVGAADRQTHSPGTEIIEVFEKDPSVQAFTSLLDRALDKPKEQPQEIILTTSEEQLRLLHAGRARAAALRSTVAAVAVLPAPEADA
jgi:hypothetical protein